MFSVPLICLVVVLFACDEKLNASTPETVQEAITKASLYLQEYGQEPDGSFSPQSGPALTALAVTALVRTGTSADSPMVLRGVQYPNVSTIRWWYYQRESAVANYETSIAILLFMSAILLGDMMR